jgi:hypothetical protein
LELNRLCVDSSTKNASSILVSSALKMLPSKSIIVSFADTGVGHVGYIYQATNWLYTGVSPAGRYYRLKGSGADETYRRRARMAKRDIIIQYGPDMVEEYNSTEKHRYVYFVGPKLWVKNAKKNLRYSVENYPKGTSHRYDASYQPNVQGILF